MPTTVQIISEDRELHRLCAEILNESLYPGAIVVTAQELGPNAHPDVRTWDCSSTTILPRLRDLSGCENNLFLVEREQVPTILDSLPCKPIGLLLKPITKSTLKPFLEQAVTFAARSTHGGNDHNHSHSDRGDILQFLLQASLTLQEYDHDRTTFLARAAHDFRAPLTAVNGYCGLLLDGSLGAISELQREALQKMRRSAQRLSRIASSLYDLSLARRSQIRLELSDCPIEECIDQAVNELNCVAEEKQLSVTVQLAPVGGRRLVFDPGRIVQLIINLLDNACRFAPKCSVIEVLGYPCFWERRSGLGSGCGADHRFIRSDESNCFRIDISDTGPGIPDECLPLIFEEYTSYEGPEDRSGGGLGLAICKTIAQAHGGAVWAESSGIGAVFSLVLPFEDTCRRLKPEI